LSGTKTAHSMLVLGAAKKWIGTPYHHQQSAINAGCDCLGLIRGVWRDLYGNEPEVVPPYSPTWSLEKGSETLAEGAARHLIAITKTEKFPGDVLIFRMRRNRPATHAAILSGKQQIIHSFDKHAVLEQKVPEIWWKNLAYVFRFPGIRVGQ